MAQILIVDDQQHVLDALELLFEVRGGLKVCRAKSPAEALERLKTEAVSVVVHDMNFSQGTTQGEEGVALFAEIRKRHPSLPVVLITAWGSLETAVALVKQGADDYVQKPWDDERLLHTVSNLLKASEVSTSAAPANPNARADYCGLVYSSASMHSLVSLALKVARSSVPVLITGPNGAGKEKLAQIVQANSARSKKPFVTVNVGALSDELFGAELFGAEAGAFTGARQRRIGRFEAADGGTLFLDEMGNLSLESQAKLLRALQSGEFERLGSNQTQQVNVRVISATNADLPVAIRRGTFREDLYYRLAGFELDVPPLSQRTEDITVLAETFARAWQAENLPGEAVPTFSELGLQALVDYPWPGNVRELQNRVRRAMLLADGAPVDPAHLGLERKSQIPTPDLVPLSLAVPSLSMPAPNFDDAERRTIQQALEQSEYMVSRAAALLGVSRQGLYRRMERLGMKLQRRL